MEIIIEHGQTKRSISGSFNICGSEKDLRSMCQQIMSKLDREDEPFTFGWINIHSDVQKNIANTEPIPWD